MSRRALVSKLQGEEDRRVHVRVGGSRCGRRTRPLGGLAILRSMWRAVQMVSFTRASFSLSLSFHLQELVRQLMGWVRPDAAEASGAAEAAEVAEAGVAEVAAEVGVAAEPASSAAADATALRPARHAGPDSAKVRHRRLGIGLAPAERGAVWAWLSWGAKAPEAAKGQPA